MKDGAAAAQRGSADVGIFGGTFNPIHLGHLRAAEEAAEILGLSTVLFVPSADPPHKTEAEETLAPAAERLAWVRAAIQDNERFQVDPLELERPGRSYSVDTVRVIGERLAPRKPVFVIGDEAFAEIGSWREPDRLLALAHFAVLRRPTRGDRRLSETLADWLPAQLARDIELDPDGRTGRHRSAGTWIRSFGIDGLDVSATAVRARIRAGRSVRYLLPEPARRAVEESGVYARKESD